MYYVGSRVGTYIAQGVYTVSGPFHPFGGAVDIIVVEQADGTFKSSPWYVKFGKFQGVLKSNEKSVAVAVNGGDAGFHMHLDHKGEAFLLRDAQGDGAGAAGEDDDAAAVSPTEGASSGDEGSSHALRLALGRGEGERSARGDRGKVAESEDDIELRFEGREASKQLIQRSVEEERRKVAAAREEIPDQIPERSSDAAADGSGSRGETGRGKIAQAMLNGAVNLESAQRSTPARAILANAALAALGGVPLSDATCPDDASPKALKPEDRNGMLIHHLLNQAIGHRSGPAVALICSAALASLRRVVSDPLSNSPSAGTSCQPDQSEPSLVLARPLDDTGGPGKVEIVDPNHKEVLVLDFTSELPVAVDALASNGITSEDISLVKSASSKENDVDEGEARGAFPEGAPRSRDLDPCDVAAELEVRKVKILEDKLIVEVGEKVEILRDDSRAKSGIPEKCDIVRSFEIDRLEMADAVHTQLGSSSQGKPARGSEITNTLEQDAAPEEVDDTEIHINVAKHLVEKLNDALSQDKVNRSNSILTEEIGIASAHAEPSLVAFETPEVSGSARADCKETTDVSNKGVVMNLERDRDPNLSLGSVEEQLPAPATETATVSTEAKNACKPVRTTADDERALEGPVSLTDVSSPRRRAALEVEIAWRDVMEKAATTLKSTPFTSKNVNHSPSYKKMGSNISDGGEKKSDGVDGQSERKTWGTWFFGGGNATQAKQNGEQNGAKGRKGSSTESKDPKVRRNELGSPSRTMTESEDVAKSNTLSKRNIVQFEASDVNVEPDGGGTQGDNYSGATEDKKQGDESPVLKGKVGDQSGKAPDYKTQQRAQLPPSRRRSIFGLLSRSNTNQSSLSSASLVQSDDGAQSAAESMRRESSLERAENVVDLLDEKWATGLDSPRRALAIASVLESGSVSNLFLDGTVRSEISGNNDGGPLKVDGVDSLVPANDRGEKVSAIELVPLPAVEASSELATPVGLNSNQTTEDLPEAVSADIHQAEDRSVADGVDEGVAIPSVSGTGPDEYDSTTKAKDMVLLSVNGCYVTAPLVDGADLQQSGEKREKTSDDGEEIKRAAKSPSHRIISFTNSSEGNSVVSTGGNHSASIQVPVLQGGEGLTRPDHTPKQLDRRGPYDGMDAIGVGSDHGLKGLASLMVLDNVGSPSSPSQKTSSYPHDHRDIRLKNSQDSARMSERWLAAEVGHLPGDNADSNHLDDVKDIQSNETETLLEADDEETQSQRQLEGYFYPKNPPSSGANEGRRVFKRNETFYMDALSGEDETDAIELTEDSPDQSRGKSVPIQIQGAVERDLISPSSNNVLSQAQTLRSLSESLPDRRDMEGLQMASPRLTLSRSLDSAPLSSVMIPESREPTSLSSDLLTMPDGRSIALAERTAQEGNRQLEQGSESKHGHIPSGRTNAATLKDQPAGPLTGFELSRCRHLLTARMGLEAASRAFASEMVALDDFRNAGSTVATDDKLVVRVGGRYYPWVVAAPIVLGILAFGQVLVAPEEGAIDVEQPIVNASAGSLTSAPSGAWKLPLWPFGGSRRPKTPEKGTPGKGNADDKASREALLRATEAALKSRLSKEYLRSAGYYKRPRKVRTNSPSSQQLASLNLKEGSNKITFTFVTRMLGKQQVHARIYLWKWNTRIVISDVDGTITKSDVLGQVMPLVGKDWTQSGVARLFSAIKQNGYELMFLSARAISQAYLTRQFLENIKQDGEVLPDGPVVISPDGLFPSLYREVIRRVPHEFKIACLEDIKSLFPPESRPFYAGFGNRDTDELSYLKVGISKGKIFIINPKGEVVVNNRVDVKSYTSLHKLVDDMFPAVTFTEQEEYNEWNFWKLPLPDIDDELSVKSAGSSSSRKGVKSARHS